MSCYYVIGVRIDNRVNVSLKLQEVLTEWLQDKSPLRLA